MAEIVAGSLVRLASGGPTMVVRTRGDAINDELIEEKADGVYAVCDWITPDGEPRFMTFRVSQLRPFVSFAGPLYVFHRLLMTLRFG